MLDFLSFVLHSNFQRKQKVNFSCSIFKCEGLNWFPGHMLKTTREIQSKLSSVDFIVEVRDARVPFSSRNNVLEAEIKNRQKRRLIVFNKSDLAHPSAPTIVSKHFSDVATLFTSTSNGFNIKNIISTCLKRYNVTKYARLYIDDVLLILSIENLRLYLMCFLSREFQMLGNHRL